jgi:hypothetical protein
VKNLLLEYFLNKVVKLEVEMVEVVNLALIFNLLMQEQIQKVVVEVVVEIFFLDLVDHMVLELVEVLVKLKSDIHFHKR